MSRFALVVFHPRRDDALHAALETCQALAAQNMLVVLTKELHGELETFAGKLNRKVALSGIRFLGVDCNLEDLEVVVVLGGDGTILKAAEMVRSSQTPIIGINLGHVGFLAESEREELAEAVHRVVDGDYLVTELLTVDVSVQVEGKE
ncbi:MAG: NAD(+)/NADH kinase, partial [Actinomycetes bacterium]